MAGLAAVGKWAMWAAAAAAIAGAIYWVAGVVGDRGELRETVKDLSAKLTKEQEAHATTKRQAELATAATRDLAAALHTARVMVAESNARLTAITGAIARLPSPELDRPYDDPGGELRRLRWCAWRAAGEAAGVLDHAYRTAELEAAAQCPDRGPPAAGGGADPARPDAQ